MNEATASTAVSAIACVAAFVCILGRRLRGRERAGAFPDEQLAYAAPASGFRSLAAAACCALAVGLLVASLLTPSGPRPSASAERALERIWICLDVSRSMTAKDAEPDRLMEAKSRIADYVRGLTGQRVALVTFAGGARVFCPPTDDYGAFAEFLTAADETTASPGGTSLEVPMRLVLRRIEDEGRSALPVSRTLFEKLILVTDGEEISLGVDGGGRAAASLARSGVSVEIWGIGTNDGAMIDADGRTVTVRLDEDALLGIARAANGRYTAPGADVTATPARAAPPALGPSAVQCLLLAAVAALAAAGLLSSTQPGPRALREGGPVMNSAAALMLVSSLLVCSLGGCPCGSKVSDLAAQGDKMARQGKPAEAAQAYRAALAELGEEADDPAVETREELQLNLACALAESGRLDESLDTFLAVSRSSSACRRSDALYGAGWVRCAIARSEPAMDRQTGYRQAVQYFCRSLAAMPDRADAMHNCLVLNSRLRAGQRAEAASGATGDSAKAGADSQGGPPGESDRAGDAKGDSSSYSQRAQAGQPGELDGAGEHPAVSASRLEELLNQAEEIEREARCFMKARGRLAAGKVARDW